MRIIFEEDIDKKPFEYYSKKKSNFLKAIQVNDDFDIYKNGKAYVSGKNGDYIIKGPLEGYWVVERKTFEQYYQLYEVDEDRENILSFRKRVIEKEMGK
tara:strand:- start:25 stop:321 length:297 start_codon:yes stop_codon:yes gene_type:complete